MYIDSKFCKCITSIFSKSRSGWQMLKIVIPVLSLWTRVGFLTRLIDRKADQSNWLISIFGELGRKSESTTSHNQICAQVKWQSECAAPSVGILIQHQGRPFGMSPKTSGSSGGLNLCDYGLRLLKRTQAQSNMHCSTLEKATNLNSC